MWPMPESKVRAFSFTVTLYEKRMIAYDNVIYFS